MLVGLENSYTVSYKCLGLFKRRQRIGPEKLPLPLSHMIRWSYPFHSHFFFLLSSFFSFIFPKFFRSFTFIFSCPPSSILIPFPCPIHSHSTFSIPPHFPIRRLRPLSPNNCTGNCQRRVSREAFPIRKPSWGDEDNSSLKRNSSNSAATTAVQIKVQWNFTRTEPRVSETPIQRMWLFPPQQFSYFITFALINSGYSVEK